MRGMKMSFAEERHSGSLQEERSLSLTRRYPEPPMKPS